VLAACHGGAPDQEAEARAPAAVTCAPIAATTVHDVLDVTGTIAPPPRLDAVLSSPIAGRVAQVAVEEGDPVAAGALLAVVEDPALPAGAAEARAAIASATATKTAAQADVARQQHLVEGGVGARRDLDDATAKLASANAELAAATARAGLADRNLARRDLRAPYAGVVLHVTRRVGESVDGTSATPIVEVADISQLELRAQVPPAALATLTDGMPATVSIGAATIGAKIVRVAPAVDPATLLGTVRLALDAGTKPPVGTAATARITTGTHPGVAVPAAALRRSLTGSDELVVCDHGVARVRPVTVGLRDGATAEIREGLQAGESVVTDHVLGIDDGQALAAPAKAK
jgi:RND family efflux transporter MFP subunit